MNITHSIFRRRYKILQLIFIAFTLILIPITVYADENPVYTGTKEVSLGVSGNNSGSGSSGASGSSIHGTSANDTGYRIYLVEKNGSSVSIMKDSKGNQYIYDLTFFNPETMGIDEAPKTTRLGKVLGSIPYRQITTDIVITPIIYSNGAFVAQGNKLAEDMLTESEDGITYAQYLIEAIFGADAIEDCRVTESYLVVEPIWCAYTWTSYSSSNVATERVYDTEIIGIYEHLYIDVGSKTYDLCCEVSQSYAGSLGLANIWQQYFYHPSADKAGYERGKGKLVSTYERKASTYTESTVYNSQYSGIYDWNSSGTTVSESTGNKFYGTYYEWLEELDSLGSNGGFLAGPKKLLGSSLYISENKLGLSAGTNLTSGCSETWDTIGSKGYGIHIYDMNKDVIKNKPIHTKDKTDGTPHPAEEPKPENQNTGECTIIKVYGNVYKDGSNYYHIEDVTTKVRTGTTDSIIIEQESPYNLVEWRVAKQSYTSLSATQWKSISSTNALTQKTLPFTTYELKESGDSGFTTTEDKPYQMGDGTVLYLLYLKTLPAIETSDTKVPDTTTDFEPTNPTYPENPSTTPSKQGGYNIIKVYTLLDQYNGTPLSSETYTQTQTTPFIKIESESNWTLASWYTTNTYKSTVKGEDFFTKATDSQLKAFYENGYNLKPESTIKSVIGNTLKSGTQPTTTYFTSGNTVYLLFTRTEGQANYDATQQLITESYLAKRFSTLGYWDALGTFHPSDLILTVTTDSKI